MKPSAYIIDTIDKRLKRDIYSFGIILNQLLSQQKPYHDKRVKGISLSKLFIKIQKYNFRPTLVTPEQYKKYYDHDKNNFKKERKFDKYKELIQMCWSQDIDDRPSAPELVDLIGNVQDDNIELDKFKDSIKDIQQKTQPNTK